MKFFMKAWSRFAPAVAIALFFVPLIAQASSDFHGQACSCGFDRPFKHCPCWRVQLAWADVAGLANQVLCQVSAAPCAGHVDHDGKWRLVVPQASH